MRSVFVFLKNQLKLNSSKILCWARVTPREFSPAGSCLCGHPNFNELLYTGYNHHCYAIYV